MSAWLIIVTLAVGLFASVVANIWQLYDRMVLAQDVLEHAEELGVADAHLQAYRERYGPLPREEPR